MIWHFLDLCQVFFHSLVIITLMKWLNREHLTYWSTHPTHFFRSQRSSTLDFHFLSHYSYIKAIMLYKGNHWTQCAGFMDASWVRLGITNDDLGTSWALPGDNLGMTWGWLGDDLGTILDSWARPDQTRPDQTRPDQTIWRGHLPKEEDVFHMERSYDPKIYEICSKGIVVNTLANADETYHCPVACTLWSFLWLWKRILDLLCCV